MSEQEKVFQVVVASGKSYRGVLPTVAALRNILMSFDSRLDDNCDAIVTEIDESDELQVDDLVRTSDGRDAIVSSLQPIHYRVKYPSGQGSGHGTWRRDGLTRKPPEPTVEENDEADDLKVGDRVRTSNGHLATVAAIERRFSLQHDDGTRGGLASWTRDELTKLPPKPTYTVQFNGTELQLLQNGEPHRMVRLWTAAPLADIIERWFEEYDIDITIEEVYKLIAKPCQLALRRAGPGAVFIAVRHAKGWQVMCGDCIQPEGIAKAFFKINGPYLTDKQNEPRQAT